MFPNITHIMHPKTKVATPVGNASEPEDEKLKTFIAMYVENER